MELQGTDSARAEIREPIERRDLLRAEPLVREVGGGQGVAEVIRQGVGDHRREAVEGSDRERGEDECRRASRCRHRRRCQLDVTRRPGRVVLERVVARSRVERDGADPRAPTANLDDVDRLVRHQAEPVPGRFLATRRRCPGTLCLARSICMGETVTCRRKGFEPIRPVEGPDDRDQRLQGRSLSLLEARHGADGRCSPAPPGSPDRDCGRCAQPAPARPRAVPAHPVCDVCA